MKTTTMKETPMGRLPVTVIAATLLLAGATVRAEIALSDRVVTTPRHVFTLDNSGLPAQIEIRALTDDLPVAWRAEKEWPATLIKRIGRGPQLAAPIDVDTNVDLPVTWTGGAGGQIVLNTFNFNPITGQAESLLCTFDAAPGNAKVPAAALAKLSKQQPTSINILVSREGIATPGGGWRVHFGASNTASAGTATFH